MSHLRKSAECPKSHPKSQHHDRLLRHGNASLQMARHPLSKMVDANHQERTRSPSNYSRHPGRGRRVPHSSNTRRKEGLVGPGKVKARLRNRHFRRRSMEVVPVKLRDSRSVPIRTKMERNRQDTRHPSRHRAVGRRHRLLPRRHSRDQHDTVYGIPDLYLRSTETRMEA